MTAREELARRIEAGRQRLHEASLIAKVEKRERAERRRRGKVIFAERFQDACRIVATRRLTVTLDDVYKELCKSSINLTWKQTARLAAEAELVVEWDGVIVRTKIFEAFIR